MLKFLVKTSKRNPLENSIGNGCRVSFSTERFSFTSGKKESRRVTSTAVRTTSLIVFPLIAVAVGLAFPPFAHSQAKLAQTGFEFLDVGTSARATGMGEAFATIDGSSESMFYNPAGIATIPSLVDVAVNQMNWIADIKYFSGVAAFAPLAGKYGVVGVSFTRVDYGQFNFTQIANNEQGYVDLPGYPAPYASAIGLAYAKQLSEQFSVGAQVKFAYQNLGNSEVPQYNQVLVDSVLTTDTTYAVKNYNLSVPAFDFGTIYRTGLKSLSFGMYISNFSRELTYERESFQLPLTFRFGVSMNLMDLMPGMQDFSSFVVSVDAVHPRSYPEYLNIGGEYTFMKTIVLRAGYVTYQDDYGLTLGVGVHKFGFAFDYSYTPHTVWNSIHRLSLRFAI